MKPPLTDDRQLPIEDKAISSTYRKHHLEKIDPAPKAANVENVVAPNFLGRASVVPRHVWVLFVLEDIANYLRDTDMPDAAAAMRRTIQNIEDEVLTKPSAAQQNTGITSLPAARTTGLEDAKST